MRLDAGVSETKSDRKAPFGAVYAGWIVGMFGFVLTLTPYAGGGAVLISGVILGCTGMVLRAMPSR